jgi:hypothetical protein
MGTGTDLLAATRLAGVLDLLALHGQTASTRVDGHKLDAATRSGEAGGKFSRIFSHSFGSVLRAMQARRLCLVVCFSASTLACRSRAEALRLRWRLYDSFRSATRAKRE